MKKALLLCGILLGSPLPVSGASPEDSVVKVFATVRYPNPLKPWTNDTLRFAESGSEVLVFRRDEMSQASGAILEDNGISATRQASDDILMEWKRAKKD